jgi:hypothetical protein
VADFHGKHTQNSFLFPLIKLTPVQTMINQSKSVKNYTRCLTYIDTQGCGVPTIMA